MYNKWCWIYSKAQKWPRTRNINKRFFCWNVNNVMWELTNFCFSIKFPFVPFWCYKIAIMWSFLHICKHHIDLSIQHFQTRYKKDTMWEEHHLCWIKLQIAHIAHPTFAFHFELSSFQHSTFRLNRIKVEMEASHILDSVSVLMIYHHFLSREQDDFSTLEDIP